MSAELNARLTGWIVFSRPDCSLCDAFITDLAALLGERAADVQVVDIDSSGEFTRKYSDRIPVLTIDGDFVCAHRLDVQRVRRYL